MPISSVRTIDTPWTPYAVTFSRDGSRLVIGGGCWYGDGGIMMLDLNREHTEWLNWMDVPAIAAKQDPEALTLRGVPTVSCLCFSDDDRYLATSMWASGHNYSPTMLFEVDGLTLRPRATFESGGTYITLPNGRTVRVRDHAPPTGVFLHHGYLITRQHNTDPEGSHVLVVDRLPAELDVATSHHLQHLTHHRLVVVRNMAITEAGGSRSTWGLQPDGTHAPIPATEGLALRDLQMPEAPLTIVGVHDCARVTAIAALPGDSGFVTGGSHGQIDRWSWDGKWHPRRLREAVTSKTEFAERFPEHIIAIVTLAGSNELVAVSADAELLILRPDGEWQSERIPHRGSPRSLAAHPSRPWVAVGIKQGGNAKPESVVGLFNVEA